MQANGDDPGRWDIGKKTMQVLGKCRRGRARARVGRRDGRV
jgi:hypothetical protein